jgi:prevent-host-death family protein
MAMFMANIADLKARLSELVDRAARGERILICRHNRPVAELRPVAESRIEPRPIGPLPGRPAFDVPASFFEPLPEDELRSWEEGPIAVGASAWPSSPAPSRAAERPPSYASTTRRPRKRR